MSKLFNLAILFLLICVAVLVWVQWDSVVAATVEWQKILHSKLAEHISAVSGNVSEHGGALILLSFGYGIFHAVGPGHGKAVIMTYLGTQRESAKKGVLISLLAAMLQSLMAIALVGGLAKIFKLRLADAHQYADDLALVSYLLVMSLGVLLLIGAVRSLLKIVWQPSRLNAGEISRKHGTQHKHSHSSSAHVHHSDDCGCSHTHVPSEGESRWQTFMVILSMGIRPCSGAIVVLIYAHLVNVYEYGVLATLMMGLGTGVSVGLIAVMTVYARSWLERFSSDNLSQPRFGVANNLMRLVGGVVLVSLGWSLYSVAVELSNNAGHPLF